MSQINTLPWKTILAIALVVALAVGGIASIRASVLGLLEAGQIAGITQRDDSALTGTPVGTGSEPTIVPTVSPQYTDEAKALTDIEQGLGDDSDADPTVTPELQESMSEEPILTLTNGVYLRTGPGTQYDVLGSEPSGFTAPITGKSADGEWYEISYGANVRVWVAADFSSVNVSESSISVVAAPPLPTATSIMTATSAPVESPTAQASGLGMSSNDAISGRTFTVEATFKPGSSHPTFLTGESVYVNMRIKNSSSEDVSFGAWGVYSDLYPNFHYVFNGDRDADKVGANTEYSWRAPITIPTSGTHGLQMGICLGQASYCLDTKPPAQDWYILSDSVQVMITTSRMAPVTPSGSPISGTLFSVEKECQSEAACTPVYSAGEQIWVNMRILNVTGEDQNFGAWGVFADPYIYRFFNGEGAADKVAAGTEYSWRDWIEISSVGSYDLKMAICLSGSGYCKDSLPPAEHWYILSESVPVTIQ